MIVESPQEVMLRVQDAESVLALDGTGAELASAAQLDEERLRAHDAALREGRLGDPAALRRFGEELWRVLFPPAVADFVAERGRRAPLRLQLVFERPAAAFASLPWEYLYGPSGHVAIDPVMTLCRYLPRQTGRPLLTPPDPPLRVLAVVSAPPGLGPVLADEPLAALEGLRRTLGIRLRVLRNPTIDDLVACIEDARPHVVHLMGHGEFDARRGEGAVALADERGSPAWVPDADFAQIHGAALFVPRLFVLHLCEGGVVDLGRSFAGVAPQLVRNGAPAVIAMQRPITNRAAIDFARAFYATLARNAPVDEAVQEARRELWREQRPGGEFAIPVLYLNSRDGVLT